MSKEEVILTNCLINYKIDLKKIQQVYDEWINKNSSAEATLRMKRSGLIIDINERDDNNKLKRSLKERKELVIVKENIAKEINNFAKEKQQYHCMIQTTTQLITNQKKKIKEKPSTNLTLILESKLFEHGIDRAKYHGGDMEGTAIIQMFQKSNEIFSEFKEDISKSIKEKDKLNEVIDVTERYIEICTLFDTLFSLSRTTCGSLTNDIIDKLKLIIKKL